MSDKDPLPKPVPFPIRIVADSVSSATSNAGDSAADPVPGKRSDNFYAAWEKFLAAQTKRAKSTSRAARKIEEVKEDVEQGPSDGLKVQENAAKSWEQAAVECKAKVTAIVDECRRLNQKYRDMLFDLESGSYTLRTLNGQFPDAIDDDKLPYCKRVEDIFDKPEFFIDGATATDVHQGNDGDCWFLAALMAVCAKKDLIDKLCVARDEAVGVYGFVFFRDGEWVYEVIDDKLFMRVGDDDYLRVVRDWDQTEKTGRSIEYDDEKLKDALQKGGEALYFSHCKSNETWLPLIEKAYAKAHGDYYAIEGGHASEGIEDLTGGVGVVLNPTDIMDKDRFWREQLSQVNEKYLFGGGSKRSASKGFVGSHAYAVLQAWEEGDLRLLKMRNPWGEFEWDGEWSDGSKQWTAEMMLKLGHTFGNDGVFWISYKDFLKNFPSINRVRLFNDEWSVAQQWTCVNVPWTVDYLDTKFQFTLSKRGPVVIVLCQPDDRYFYGLRGRYLYSMHFRLYKRGDDSRWIVRSMHNSGNETVFTRSVSAEIEDLEPGTYDIIFKVTAVRTAQSTAAEAIKRCAMDRKDKLLAVGRRFDYAQAKGNLKAMEEANKQWAKDDKRSRIRDGWKKARKLNRLERERAKKRKKRVDDAMFEQRKALAQRHPSKKTTKGPQDGADASSVVAETGTSTEGNSEAKVENATPPTDDDAPKVLESVNNEASNVVEKEGDTKPPSPVEQASEGIEAGVSKLSVQDDGEPTPNTAKQEGNDAEKPDPEGSVSGEEDQGYDSPPEEPDDLQDDDFDWDSDIDGNLFSSDDDDDGEDIFADDPWNAMCVLGLRVYSQDTDLKVNVIKGEGDS